MGLPRSTLCYCHSLCVVIFLINETKNSRRKPFKEGRSVLAHGSGDTVHQCGKVRQQVWGGWLHPLFSQCRVEGLSRLSWPLGMFEGFSFLRFKKNVFTYLVCVHVHTHVCLSVLVSFNSHLYTS